MPRLHDVVVVGAGQAGLAASFHLKRQGIDHVVLEKGRVAETWRIRRWDSFTLVAPNWTCALPGAPYAGRDRDGFMCLADIMSFFTTYARQIGAPVREGVGVERVRREPSSGTFTITTTDGELQARNVIAATGAYQRPTIPSHRLDAQIASVHTADYRGPAQLPPGGVLVVGSGQSGAQIAEDLAGAGRDVWLASGTCGWIPRRYRGRDNVSWRQDMGLFDLTIDTLSSELRFAAIPMQTGRDGGHDINLRTLAALGVHIVGRFISGSDLAVTVAGDAEQNVRAGDAAAIAFRKTVDDFIRDRGIVAPDEGPIDDGPPAVELATQLDLGRLGIRSVLWSTGWAHDYTWIHEPFCGERGYPIQRRGVTNVPGLYVLGLQLMWKRKSGLIFGVGEDAEYLADRIAAGQGG